MRLLPFDLNKTKLYARTKRENIVHSQAQNLSASNQQLMVKYKKERFEYNKHHKSDLLVDRKLSATASKWQLSFPDIISSTIIVKTHN